MSRVELKNWAKDKIKGHIWELLVPILVAGILTGLTVGQQYTMDGGTLKVEGGVSLGIFFYFVQVGLIWFMIKFINDQPHEFKDLFHFTNDYVRIFLVNLLQLVFIVLWTLLLIVPGVIKAFAYALVPYLLADDNYKGLGYRELLKKSEEMMNGHKMDYFVFCLSFIGWFFLLPFTLGLLGIWLVPYFTTAQVKFLNDIKTSAEGSSTETKVVEENVSTSEAKVKCSNCGTEVDAGNEFCTNCGQKMK